jgi:hypothetical protein
LCPQLKTPKPICSRLDVYGVEAAEPAAQHARRLVADVIVDCDPYDLDPIVVAARDGRHRQLSDRQRPFDGRPWRLLKLAVAGPVSAAVGAEFPFHKTIIAISAPVLEGACSA